MTNPINAIGAIDQLTGEVARLSSFLRNEADGIKDQWEGLKRCGGAREDHAAEILARLRMILDDLAKFCTRTSAEITAMKADPFERKQEAA
jgi:hypothetical protein